MRIFVIFASLALVACHASDSGGVRGTLPSDFPVALTVSDVEAPFQGTTGEVRGHARLKVAEFRADEAFISVRAGYPTALAFSFQNKVSVEEMNALMRGEEVERQFSNPLSYYYSSTRVRRFRYATSLRFAFEPATGVSTLTIKLGESDDRLQAEFYDGSVDQDASASATARAWGVFSPRCEVHDDVGRILDDANWESEYCASAIDRFGLRQLLESQL